MTSLVQRIWWGSPWWARLSVLALSFLGVATLAACGGTTETPDGDGDADTDGDTDVDGDADTDLGEGDADLGSDGDFEGDADEPIDPESPFVIEAIPTEDLGHASEPKLVVDSAGAPWIALSVDGGAEGLWLASRDGGNWSLEAIPQTEDALDFDLAIDGDDGLHLIRSLGVTDNAPIRYGSFDGSSWELTDVEADVPAYPTAGGVRVSIDVAEDGRIGVTYAHPDQDLVPYLETSDSGSPWSFFLVAPTFVEVLRPSPRFDSSGARHLAYAMPIDGAINVYYARFDSAMGHFVENQEPFYFQSLPDLETSYIMGFDVDSGGTAHFVLQDQGSSELVYFRRTGHYEWEREVVAAFGSIVFMDLAVSDEGVPHLAFADDGAGNISYATRGDDGWELVVLADDGSSGGQTYQWPSIALDPEGEPHIAYRDGQERTVMYAVRR